MRASMDVLAVSLLVGVAACGSSPSGPKEQSLVGTWAATSVQFVSTEGLGTVDVINDHGGTGTLVLNADHTFTFDCTDPGHQDIALTGTWETPEPGDLALHMPAPPGMTNEMDFSVSLSGNTLTLKGAHREYDFNGDGVPHEARLNLALAR